MSILALLIAVAVVGLALYVVNARAPLDAEAKTLVSIVLGVLFCLSVLHAFVGETARAGASGEHR